MNKVDPMQLMNKGNLRRILRKTFKELDNLELLSEIGDLKLTRVWLGKNSVFQLAYEANAAPKNYENIGQTLKKNRIIPANYCLRDEKPQNFDDDTQLAFYIFKLTKDKSYQVELTINRV